MNIDTIAFLYNGWDIVIVVVNDYSVLKKKNTIEVQTPFYIKNKIII